MMRDYVIDSLALIGLGAAVGVVLVCALAASGPLDPPAPLWP